MAKNTYVLSSYKKESAGIGQSWKDVELFVIHQGRNLLIGESMCREEMSRIILWLNLTQKKVNNPTAH